VFVALRLENGPNESVAVGNTYEGRLSLRHLSIRGDTIEGDSIVAKLSIRYLVWKLDGFFFVTDTTRLIAVSKPPNIIGQNCPPDVIPGIANLKGSSGRDSLRA
jgi:hypothetical protein